MNAPSSGLDTTTTGVDIPFSLEDILTCDLDLSKAELPLLIISTLIVNILALLVLKRMRKACENVDHVLVCILNLNDLLTTVICLITWIGGWASCGRFLLNASVCSVFGWLTSAMVVWSAFILAIMASCRYLSLVKPFYYRISVTRHRVVIASLGSLAFSLILFVFPMTGMGQPFLFYYENNICAANFAPGGSTVAHRAFIGFCGALGSLTILYVVVCNFFIIKTLRSRATIDHCNVVTISQGLNAINSGKAPTQGRQMKRVIFERVSLVVSLVYVFCYSPFSIRLLVDTAENRDHQNNVSHVVSMTMLFMSPLLNPIIYGLFNRHFRRTFIGMFRCRRQQAQNSVSEQVTSLR